jgi:Ca2+/Na+ antiporter
MPDKSIRQNNKLVTFIIFLCLLTMTSIHNTNFAIWHIYMYIYMYIYAYIYLLMKTAVRKDILMPALCNHMYS